MASARVEGLCPAAAWNVHAWGIAGGLIWGVGTIANFVASYLPMIGPATSFIPMGEGNTHGLRIRGVFFVWKEFPRGEQPCKAYPSPLCFLCSCGGATSIGALPGYQVRATVAVHRRIPEWYLHPSWRVDIVVRPGVNTNLEHKDGARGNP